VSGRVRCGRRPILEPLEKLLEVLWDDGIAPLRQIRHSSQNPGPERFLQCFRAVWAELLGVNGLTLDLSEVHRGIRLSASLAAHLESSGRRCMRPNDPA